MTLSPPQAPPAVTPDWTTVAQWRAYRQQIDGTLYLTVNGDGEVFAHNADWSLNRVLAVFPTHLAAVLALTAAGWSASYDRWFRNPRF